MQVGETATLFLAAPDKYTPLIARGLYLMNRYGTLGGRSRNGWGSFELLPSPTNGGPAGGDGIPLALRDWQACLALDWPHAIGQDAEAGPLIWQTAPYDNWKSLMVELANIKIRLRTQFGFSLNAAAGDRQAKRGIDHGQPQDRHWLSYPVTNHTVSPPWGGSARLPNSLRFKVRTAPNDPKKVGVIFHVPCLPPPELRPDLSAITTVWQRVHRFLDAPVRNLTRSPR
ncbi:MAG: hypothetical protein ACREEP_13505 [Dongiaceae bacterium]